MFQVLFVQNHFLFKFVAVQKEIVSHINQRQHLTILCNFPLTSNPLLKGILQNNMMEWYVQFPNVNNQSYLETQVIKLPLNAQNFVTAMKIYIYIHQSA